MDLAWVIAWPDRIRARRVLAVKPTLWLLLVAGYPAQAAAAPLDFGDAPERRAAGYSLTPGITATFPTDTGPRHRSSRLRLGLRHDRENSSRQVDRDRSDDGVLTMNGMRACRSSIVRVVVDASRLPAEQRRRGSIYVNGWFDWNRNGRWGDPAETCADEWAIQNVRLPARRLGADGRAMVPVRLRAGPNLAEFWSRITVTLGERLPGSPESRLGAAQRPLRFGETEDTVHRVGTVEEVPTLVRRRTARAVGLRDSPAAPAPAPAPAGKTLSTPGFTAECQDLRMRHGDREEVALSLVYHRDGEPFRIRPERFVRGEDVEVEILRFFGGAFRSSIRGFAVTSKKRHDRPLGPEERITVAFKITGHGSSGTLECPVVIQHLDEPPPVGEPEPRADPRNQPPFEFPPWKDATPGIEADIRCNPDPLRMRHGLSDTINLVVRDARATSAALAPTIQVELRAPQSQTASFQLVQPGPGETRPRNALSHTGVLVTSTNVHATATPIESYTVAFVLGRSNHRVVLLCPVEIVHDPLAGGTQDPPPEEAGSSRGCFLLPGSSDTADCAVAFDRTGAGASFRVRTGTISGWTPPEGMTCGHPSGTAAELRCVRGDGGPVEAGEVLAPRLKLSGTDLSEGLEVLFVDRNGKDSTSGAATID